MPDRASVREVTIELPESLRRSITALAMPSRESTEIDRPLDDDDEDL